MDSASQAKSGGDGAVGDQALLRIELGGGGSPRGGFLNYDIVDMDGVDCVCDFNEPLPLKDDSVAEMYSSHCLEHVRNVTALLREICRVCVAGAKVTIAVPHFGQEMSMCPGHIHVISEKMVDHFGEFRDSWWIGKKMLRLVSKGYTPTNYFREAKSLFPHLSDAQIYRFIQNTCHEVIFEFEVVSR